MEAPVELQPFRPDGTGPQGSGGIPPEEFTQPLQDQGIDLVGAGRRPEDSAAVQAVLDREATSLAAQLGVKLPSDERPMDPQAPAEPATPLAAETQGEAPAEDDLKAKVQKVIEKYGGNKGKLAEAYVRSNAEASRLATGLSTENAQIRGELAALNAQLSRIANGILPQPGRGPEPVATTPIQIDDETFREKPVESIGQIVRAIVREENVALETARARERESERLQESQRQNADDIERLRPVMRDLYNRDPDVYAAMGESRALSFLLERAREREDAQVALQAYQDVRGLLEDPYSVSAGAVPGAPAAIHPGTLARSGPVSARARAAAGAPNGNWSATRGMQRLFSRNDGSVDEMRELVNVLGERGHGEHLG